MTKVLKTTEEQEEQPVQNKWSAAARKAAAAKRSARGGTKKTEALRKALKRAKAGVPMDLVKTHRGVMAGRLKDLRARLGSKGAREFVKARFSGKGKGKGN